MPVIRRFKPTIGGSSAAPTPAGEHVPPITSPTAPDGPGPPPEHVHHHHRHHSVSFSKEPPAVSIPPVTNEPPVPVENSPKKRPTSISIAVCHSPLPSVPPPKIASPPPTTSAAPELPPVVVKATEPPKIKRAHQIFQENLIIFNNQQEKTPPSPSYSSSSRPGSPTASIADSTTSLGTQQKKTRQRSLLARPIELPNKDEIVVENLKMRDYLLFNPDGSPMRWHRQDQPTAPNPEENVLQPSSSNIKQRLRSTSMMSPPAAPQPQSSGTPRVRLGESGEAIINEESLVIDTTGPRPDPNTISKVGAVHEELESTTTYTTYANYRRKGKVRGRRWSKEETARFFVALRCCGLDFSMISKFFPDRDERELRSKFKAEDKRDPDVVTRFLNGQGDDDMGTYDPLALLATSSSFKEDSKKKKREKKEQPSGNSKRGEGVPRGRGPKVRLTIGEDSISSDSGAASDEDKDEEPIEKMPKTKQKVIISESEPQQSV